MALFMKIEGVDIPGSVELVGLDGAGWFIISSASYALYRDIDMEVGRMGHAEKSLLSFSPVHVSRRCDPASYYLQSLIFCGGIEGKEVAIASTIPAEDGKGIRATEMQFLIGVRFSSLSRELSETGINESFSMTYTEMETEFFELTPTGELTSVGKTAYDLKNAAMTSGAQ